MRDTAALIGERIRRAREAAGQSQVELAETLGKGQAALSHWETGRRLPGLEDLLKIAAALDTPVGTLLPDAEPQRASGAVLLRAMLTPLGTKHLEAQLENFIQRAEAQPLLERLITVPSDRASRTATELLMRATEFGVQPTIERPYVDVDALATLCGVHVIQEPFEDGLSGLLVMLDNGAAIGVNQQHPDGRKRFTIAHELGHYLLAHYDRFHLDLPSAEAGESPLFDWRLEREANQFAADLLMPAALVQAKVAQGDTVGQLAAAFDVSPVAMGYRVTNLGLAALPTRRGG